ncbi:outer membrane lipoprotein LolB [Geobacter pelophilus]|uniref:Outer-membrane lipoprotein LolB n=1 Tax=Geoanaerobacter pelophilus TaxID=60036 RepID=A0AAW4L2X0_9BACT|nr:outer membrane lipoprotein LolB [Geoanaerobacter pelophilus]MBT0663338.1 outer membrane lipoprotein LolB [Geoanaerobacter pelophilus]
MNYRVFMVIMVMPLLLFGCAARSVAVTVPLNPAATINTLTSSVALSIKAGEKGLSGRGYLIMRSPDQFRLVILSPFGTTVAEMFLNGDHLLYVASSQNLAYQGLLSDLPNAPALQGWRLLRWTTERVFPEKAGQEHLSRRRADGERETIDFDSQGLVLKKNVDGDEVRYEGYQSVDGVPVPTTIEITDRLGITVRITLDEPEVNTALDEKAFVPVLEGVTVLPLSQFPVS